MGKVFISYSHDGEEHIQRVRQLADRLKTYNLQVVIDRDMLPGGPNEGWDHWSEAQVREADNVLLACTERYCARYEGREAAGVGLGAIAEARLIHRTLHTKAGVNPNFRVILFEEADKAHVPDTLQTYHRFPLYHPNGLTDLVAWLTVPLASLASLHNPAVLWPPPPTQHLWDMANRQEVTACLEKMLTGRSEKRILLLTAGSNSGKTHLLAELKAYAKHLGLAHSSADCKGGPALDELVSLLQFDLHRAYSSDSRPYVRFIGELLQSLQPVLLSFDTYEQASLPFRNWMENQLLPRLDASSGVVVVIAGQQVPERTKHVWAGLVDEFKLDPIRRVADWLEYSRRKYHPNVNLDHIQALTLAAQGDPGKISALLEIMMSGLKVTAGA